MDVAGVSCPTLKGQVQSQLYSFANRALVLDELFISELKEAVTAISKMPTERTVLPLSDGFSRFPGDELYAILRDASVADLDLRMNSHGLQPQVNSVLMLDEKFDVRFYTVDSRGLYSVGRRRGRARDRKTEAATHSLLCKLHGSTVTSPRNWKNRRAASFSRTATTW